MADPVEKDNGQIQKDALPATDELVAEASGNMEAPEAPASTKTQKTQAEPSMVQVRVLQICGLGNPNDLIEVPQDAVHGLEREKLVDSSFAAVAYAKALKYGGLEDQAIEG